MLYFSDGTLTSFSDSYVAIHDKITWFEARNECLKKNLDLATFNTDNHGSVSWFFERNVERNLLRDDTLYWIGLVKSSWVKLSSNGKNFG